MVGYRPRRSKNIFSLKKFHSHEGVLNKYTNFSGSLAQTLHLNVTTVSTTHLWRLPPMKFVAKSLALSAAALMISTGAFAQQMSAGRAQLMTSVPSSSLTVTDWYKQNVYDPNNNKIGEIGDVLVGSNGEVNAVIIEVGGFLGAGEKDVAVSFGSIKKTMKDNKVYLTMDTTKDALKGAPGFKYDSDKTSWVPASNK